MWRICNDFFGKEKCLKWEGCWIRILGFYQFKYLKIKLVDVSIENNKVTYKITSTAVIDLKVKSDDQLG